MTTPTGRAAVGASRLGHEYQDVIGWQQALHAAHPTSTATEFHIESPQGASYDDVATIDPRTSRYVQAKHVVDAPDAFTFDWLIEPVGKVGESMAQKALRTYRTLRTTGPVELWLCTNRELANGDVLGRLRHPKTFTLEHVAKRVLDGHHTDPLLLDTLSRLQGHLGCDQDELVNLLEVWKLQWAYGMAEAERLARSEMRAFGLRDDANGLQAGVAFIAELVTLGARTLPVEELRSRIAALGLGAGRHYRTLSVAAVDAEPNAAAALVHVDLRDSFEGRVGDEARGLDNWTGIDTRLADGVARLGPPGAAPVLVHAAARLPMWFRLGTLMRATAGWTVACELGGVLYASDTAPLSTDVLESSVLTGAGDELVVTVNITHDIREVVTRRLNELALGATRRLDLSVPSPGQNALAGPAAARRISEQIKTALLNAAEETTTTHIRLFLACPKPIPLLLGTQWHRLTPVTVYEDLGPGRGYQPAFTVPN